MTLRDLNHHEDYLALIASDTTGRHSTTYGINNTSPLLNLPGFDVTKCLPFDIMHSIFEGVARRHLNLLFHHLIDSHHYLDLSQLNHSIKLHPYGYSEADTKPTLIDRESSSTSDFRIKQSGASIMNNNKTISYLLA